MNRIKHLLTIACLLIGTTFMYGQSDCDKHEAFLCEDFESYDETMPLGPQSDAWTTWSGTEGGAEDGGVTTDQAKSGTKSMVVTGGGTQDVVLEMTDITTGRFRVRFDIYIPEGNGAYYNIQHDFDGGAAIFEWASQINFAPGGFATLDAGAGADAVFEYATDEWVRVDQIIDLDADTTSISVGGRYIRSWKFSHQAVPAAGLPPGEPGTNAIAAVNFYPIDAAYLYYVDDVFIEALPDCSIDASAIICDNMDGYTADEPVGPQSSFWSTWSVADGGSEDATVSTAQAFSGANSILIDNSGAVDATVHLGNRTEGNYTIQMMMYIPTGADGYFNLHDNEVPNPPTTQWLGEFYFGYDGTNDTEGMGAINLDGTTFAHPHDAWFMVRADVNLDANTLNFWVDGVQVYTDYAILDVNLGCIDLFSASIPGNNTMEMYVDDLIFKVIDPSCDDAVVTDATATSEFVCFGESYSIDADGSVIPAYNELGNLSGFIWGVYSEDVSGSTDPFNEPSFVNIIGGFLPSNNYPVAGVNDGGANSIPSGTYWFSPIYIGNTINTTGYIQGFDYTDGCVITGNSVQITLADEIPAISATTASTESTGADGTATVTASGGTGTYTYLWGNGDTNATATDLPPGEISCEITTTDANGCSRSLTVFVTVGMSIAVEDIAILESLTVSPNPTSGNLVVDLSLSETATVQLQIVSVTGKVLAQFNPQSTNSFQQSVDLSHLANGLYFAKINVGNDAVVKKINLIK